MVEVKTGRKKDGDDLLKFQLSEEELKRVGDISKDENPYNVLRKLYSAGLAEDALKQAKKQADEVGGRKINHLQRWLHRRPVKHFKRMGEGVSLEVVKNTGEGEETVYEPQTMRGKTGWREYIERLSHTFGPEKAKELLEKHKKEIYRFDWALKRYWQTGLKKEAIAGLSISSKTFDNRLQGVAPQGLGRKIYSDEQRKEKWFETLESIRIPQAETSYSGSRRTATGQSIPDTVEKEPDTRARERRKTIEQRIDGPNPHKKELDRGAFAESIARQVEEAEDPKKKREDLVKSMAPKLGLSEEKLGQLVDRKKKKSGKKDN